MDLYALQVQLQEIARRHGNLPDVTFDSVQHDMHVPVGSIAVEEVAGSLTVVLKDTE